MRGGITEEVYELCLLPQRYPDVIVEETLYIECCGMLFHRIFKRDYWEDIRTIDDILHNYDCNGIKFSPNMLELETFRNVYDNGGNVISKERKKVLHPIEEMPEEICNEYENWKEDPIKWEEKQEREKVKLIDLLKSIYTENTAFNNDDLPF